MDQDRIFLSWKHFFQRNIISVHVCEKKKKWSTLTAVTNRYRLEWKRVSKRRNSIRAFLFRGRSDVHDCWEHLVWDSFSAYLVPKTRARAFQTHFVHYRFNTQQKTGRTVLCIGRLTVNSSRHWSRSRLRNLPKAMHRTGDCVSQVWWSSAEEISSSTHKDDLALAIEHDERGSAIFYKIYPNLSE